MTGNLRLMMPLFHMNAWAGPLALASPSGSLLVDRGAGSRNWVPATLVGDPDYVVSSWFQCRATLAVGGIWEVNQLWEIWLPLFCLLQ